MKNYCLWFVTVIITNIVKESKSQSFMEKIVDGEIASINETKFQVSIRLNRLDKPFGNGHFCGGSAISHKTIMTAAHCLWGGYVLAIRRLLSPHEISVVMGSTKRDDNGPLTLIFDVKEMDFHRKYKEGTVQNDVGLLFLEGEIPVGHPTAHPISLASKPLQEGKHCRVSGWGRVSENGPLPNDLLIITVRTLAPSTCRARFASLIFAAIRTGMLCAEGEGKKDVCKGDSGGPLVCDNEVTGIVSWGVKCGDQGHPGVYTDVYYFRDWILENGAHSIHLDFVNFKIASLLSLLLIAKQWIYFNRGTYII